MLRVSSLPLVLCLALGCNSAAKHENPVFGPTPRRTSLEDAPDAKAIADADVLDTQPTDDGPAGGMQLASFQTSDDSDLFLATVVARADGAPIFAGEVLERYGDYLRHVREKATDEQYQQIREEIIRRDLKGHIQKHLLVERTKGELKPDQLKALNAQLEKLFDQQVENLKKELEVPTRTELERKLIERGTSLNDIRNGFINQGIAKGYIEARAERPKTVNPPDLRKYYQSHQEEFGFPAKVHWRQIQISHTGNGGRANAEKKLREAQAELARGAPFETLVAKYSDGPTKDEQGVRDWTTQGSLADEKLDELLFRLEANAAPEPYFGKDACQLVQVIDRTDAGVTPFTEVQDEIYRKLQPTGPENVKELLDKIYSEAVIETKYAYDGKDGDA
jgi:parvulin-like peptidyl-prolyl isomerase